MAFVKSSPARGDLGFRERGMLPEGHVGPCAGSAARAAARARGHASADPEFQPDAGDRSRKLSRQPRRRRSCRPRSSAAGSARTNSAGEALGTARQICTTRLARTGVDWLERMDRPGRDQRQASRYQPDTVTPAGVTVSWLPSSVRVPYALQAWTEARTTEPGVQSNKRPQVRIPTPGGRNLRAASPFRDASEPSARGRTESPRARLC